MKIEKYSEIYYVPNDIFEYQLLVVDDEMINKIEQLSKGYLNNLIPNNTQENWNHCETWVNYKTIIVKRVKTNIQNNLYPPDSQYPSKKNDNISMGDIIMLSMGNKSFVDNIIR